VENWVFNVNKCGTYSYQLHTDINPLYRVKMEIVSYNSSLMMVFILFYFGVYCDIHAR